jgi:hypothetical protein
MSVRRYVTFPINGDCIQSLEVVVGSRCKKAEMGPGDCNAGCECDFVPQFLFRKPISRILCLRLKLRICQTTKALGNLVLPAAISHHVRRLSEHSPRQKRSCVCCIENDPGTLEGLLSGIGYQKDEIIASRLWQELHFYIRLLKAPVFSGSGWLSRTRSRTRP